MSAPIWQEENLPKPESAAQSGQQIAVLLSRFKHALNCLRRDAHQGSLDAATLDYAKQLLRDRYDDLMRPYMERISLSEYVVDHPPVRYDFNRDDDGC